MGKKKTLHRSIFKNRRDQKIFLRGKIKTTPQSFTYVNKPEKEVRGRREDPSWTQPEVHPGGTPGPARLTVWPLHGHFQEAHAAEARAGSARGYPPFVETDVCSSLPTSTTCPPDRTTRAAPALKWLSKVTMNLCQLYGLSYSTPLQH